MSRPEPAPIVAAIDCGTNTVRLLIRAGERTLVRESRIVRLGQGVDATGRLAEPALERASACLEEYAALLRQHPVARLRFCATSATRDAANADVFAELVRERLGVTPDVLSGAEEAELAFAGAIAGLGATPPAPVLVMDVGGGSTELILGAATPSAAYSMDIGSVRLHERHLHSDPPTAAEIAACAADVDAALDDCPVDPAAAASVIGVAGTFLTIAAGALGLRSYDRALVDQAELSVEAFAAMTERLLAAPVAERATWGFVSSGRLDVIGAGALIVSRVLARTFVATVIASESDILDGIAAAAARSLA
jgi:exopolyphosphatase/guanosine-5'-triphosphate,3'-diphosphate pyrophosphatase